jgi:hypothetical protein
LVSPHLAGLETSARAAELRASAAALEGEQDASTEEAENLWQAKRTASRRALVTEKTYGKWLMVTSARPHHLVR